MGFCWLPPLLQGCGIAPFLAQCVLHTSRPQDPSSGTEFVSTRRQESRTTHHLTCSAKEGDDAHQ